jgi:hypothetical protein
MFGPLSLCFIRWWTSKCLGPKDSTSHDSNRNPGSNVYHASSRSGEPGQGSFGRAGGLSVFLHDVDANRKVWPSSELHRDEPTIYGSKFPGAPSPLRTVVCHVSQFFTGNQFADIIAEVF